MNRSAGVGIAILTAEDDCEKSQLRKMERNTRRVWEIMEACASGLPGRVRP